MMSSGSLSPLHLPACVVDSRYLAGCAMCWPSLLAFQGYLKNNVFILSCVSYFQTQTDGLLFLVLKAACSSVLVQFTTSCPDQSHR